jgi:hypothetical protein
MDDCQQFVEKLLADDRQWLVEQPGLANWPDCCRRLGGAMCTWIEQIASNWTSNPPHCANDSQGPAAAGQPATPSAADLVPADPAPTDSVKADDRLGHIGGCLRRLWHVWRHHWRDAQRQAGGPVDGFEVAAAVQGGYGFRKYRQLLADGAANVTAEDSATVQQLAKGHLGGNPFHDTVLVELATGGDADSIDYLKKTFSYIARQVATTRKRRYDPDDWHSFVNTFLSSGRLSKYEGASGLSNYLAISYARDYSDPKLGRQSVGTEVRRVSFREQWIALDEVLSDDRRRELAAYLQSVDGDPTSKEDYRWRVRRASSQLTAEEQVAWQRHLEDARQQKQRILATNELDDVSEHDVEDCTSLLVQLLTAALQVLESRERFSLYQRYRAGTLAKAVAEQLGVSAGQFSRIEAKAVAKLVAYVQERVKQDDAFAECCRECWQLLSGRDALLRLSELLGEALAEQAKHYQPPDGAPSAGEKHNETRSKESTGKRGATSAPKLKGGK